MMMIWRMSDEMAPSVLLGFVSSFWSIDGDNDVRKSGQGAGSKSYVIPSKIPGLDRDDPHVGEKGVHRLRDLEHCRENTVPGISIPQKPTDSFVVEYPDPGTKGGVVDIP